MFKNQIIFFYFSYNSIQNPVYKTSAFGGTVCFCNLDIFVERDTGWDGFKRKYLGNCHLHNNHIHKCNTIQIPFVNMFFD